MLKISSAILCIGVTGIFMIAMTPDVSCAAHHKKFPVFGCGFTGCMFSPNKTCGYEQIQVSQNETSLEPKCVNSTDLPKNVTGPCSEVVCLPGYNCTVNYRRLGYWPVAHPECQPISLPPKNVTSL